MENIPGVNKIIEKSFISVFDSISKGIEIRRNFNEIISNGSQKYSNWVIETFGSIHLFGVNRTSHVSELHIKLGFTDDIDREKLRNLEEIKGELEKPKVRKKGKPIDEIIESAYINKTEQDGNFHKIFCDVALLGVAGSGKTTTLKYLMLLAAQGKKFRGFQRFPFFISLRDVHIEPGCLRREMSHFFENMGLSYGDDLALRFIKEGLALLLIDGIDELDEDKQLIVLNDIKSIKKILPKKNNIKTIICLSGRPYSLYKSLDGFIKYDVLDLSDIDRDKFIDNWHKRVDPEKGKKLKKYLSKNDPIAQLTYNPLLLSIICALYYNEYDIPKREDEVLRACLEGLIGKWDLFRDIDRKTLLKDLSITRRIDLLTNLAARTLFEKRKLVFSPDDEQVISTCNYLNSFYQELDNCDPGDLLKCLYNDFSILVERSQNIYSFSHLKFQEYLSGKWLVDQRREIEFIDSINNNILVWNYTVEYLCKSIKLPKELLLKITKKINYENPDEVVFLRKILSDNEVVLSKEERQDIILSFAPKVEYLLSKINAEVYVYGYLVLNFDLAKNLDNIRGAVLSLKELVELIADNFSVVTEELSNMSRIYTFDNQPVKYVRTTQRSGNIDRVFTRDSITVKEE